eukprot:scaffold1466_cov385-Prasinococcus_capsulatus_cf.AAC.21
MKRQPWLHGGKRPNCSSQLSRVPIRTATSHRDRHSVRTLVPSRGCEEGPPTKPLAMLAHTKGTCSSSTAAVARSSRRQNEAPLPKTSNGLLALFRTPAASSSRSRASWVKSRGTSPLVAGAVSTMGLPPSSAGIVSLHTPRRVSAGISTSTGPGRPLMASALARCKSRPMLHVGVTWKMALAYGRTAVSESNSWNAPLPASPIVHELAIINMGRQLIQALVNPARACTSPGPPIVTRTPGTSPSRYPAIEAA